MRTEVQRFLEHEIYENTTQVAPPYAPGSWPAILTAPYTFVNQALFNPLRRVDVRVRNRR